MASSTKSQRTYGENFGDVVGEDGGHGSRRQWHRGRGDKLYLPSLIIDNVRLLGNKVKKLTALTRSQNVSIGGFQTVQVDRDCTKSGKKRGSGIGVFINSISEILVVGLRPYYLPRDISHLLL